jgi:hypothetical protein
MLSVSCSFALRRNFECGNFISFISVSPLPSKAQQIFDKSMSLQIGEFMNKSKKMGKREIKREARDSRVPG